MSDDQNQAVISLLNNITRDISQIRTDLAVNTTKTGYIEEHLRTLNGKVANQEQRLQVTEKTSESLTTSKRKWDDGWRGVLKQLGIFVLGLLAAYIASTFFRSPLI